MAVIADSGIVDIQKSQGIEVTDIHGMFILGKRHPE